MGNMSVCTFIMGKYIKQASMHHFIHETAACMLKLCCVWGVLASKSLPVIRAGCASNQCHACSTSFIHWSMCVELLYASLLLFVCGWDHHKCVFVSFLSLFQLKIRFHTWLVWLKTTDCDISRKGIVNSGKGTDDMLCVSNWFGCSVYVGLLIVLSYQRVCVL